MAKHEVACVACGRMFDAEQGGKYNPNTKRYTCPECAARQYDAAVAEMAKKIRRQTIIKLLIAAFLLYCGFSYIGKESAGVVIITFIAATGLIAWAIVPLLIAKRKAEQNGET